MKKEKIRKALKSLGIASLIASIGFLASGCKKEAGSCGHTSCGSTGSDTHKSSTSCGKGSCGR